MLEPIKNRLIVQKDEVAAFTETGLTIPDSVRKQEERQQEFGMVVATGKDVETPWMGQRVIFGKSDGIPIEPVYCDGLERCILLSETHIKGIILP